MYCEKCGVAIPDESKYCYRCGKKVIVNILPKRTETEFKKTELRKPNTVFKKAEQIGPSDGTNKKRKDKIILITFVASIIVVFGIIWLIVYVLGEYEKQTPKYLLNQNTWYRYIGDNHHECLRFWGDGVLFTPNVDKQLSDTIGVYTLDGTTIIYKPESGSVRYIKFKEAKDENIDKGLYSFASDEWYVSDKYLYFDKRLYKSSDFYWSSIPSTDSKNPKSSKVTPKSSR